MISWKKLVELSEEGNKKLFFSVFDLEDAAKERTVVKWEITLGLRELRNLDLVGEI